MLPLRRDLTFRADWLRPRGGCEQLCQFSLNDESNLIGAFAQPLPGSVAFHLRFSLSIPRSPLKGVFRHNRAFFYGVSACLLCRQQCLQCSSNLGKVLYLFWGLDLGVRNFSKACQTRGGFTYGYGDSVSPFGTGSPLQDSEGGEKYAIAGGFGENKICPSAVRFFIGLQLGTPARLGSLSTPKVVCAEDRSNRTYGLNPAGCISAAGRRECSGFLAEKHAHQPHGKQKSYRGQRSGSSKVLGIPFHCFSPMWRRHVSSVGGVA